MKHKSKRISIEEMERLAFETPGAEIELASEFGLAFLLIGDTEYIATIEQAVS